MKNVGSSQLFTSFHRTASGLQWFNILLYKAATKMSALGNASVMYGFECEKLRELHRALAGDGVALRTLCNGSLSVTAAKQIALDLCSVGSIIWCSFGVPPRSLVLQALYQAAGLLDTVLPMGRGCSSPRTLLVVAETNFFTGEAQLLDWMFRVESTYCQSRGHFDQDAASRNEMRLVLSAFFPQKRAILLPDGSAAADRVVLGIRGLIPKSRSCLTVSSAVVQKVASRLNELVIPEWPEHLENAERQWVQGTVSAIFRDEFISYCSHRLHRLTAEAVRAQYQHVLDRCRRALSAFGRSNDLFIETFQKNAATQLENALQAVLQHTGAKAATSTRIVTHPLLTEGNERLLPWIQRCVPRRYQTWARGHGLATVAVTLLLLFAAGFVWSRG